MALTSPLPQFPPTLRLQASPLELFMTSSNIQSSMYLSLNTEAGKPAQSDFLRMQSSGCCYGNSFFEFLMALLI